MDVANVEREAFKKELEFAEEKAGQRLMHLKANAEQAAKVYEEMKRDLAKCDVPSQILAIINYSR